MSEPTLEEVLDVALVEDTEHLMIPATHEPILVAGADLAAKYPSRYGGTRFRIGTREPCVCGHPTGDCAPHD